MKVSEIPSMNGATGVYGFQAACGSLFCQEQPIGCPGSVIVQNLAAQDEDAPFA